MSKPAPLTSRDDVEIEGVRPVWEGRFTLELVRFRNRRFDGTRADSREWELWRRGRAAAVLPYDPVRDVVVLIEQFRVSAFAAGFDPVMVEIPAGMCDGDETAEATIRREAQEEMHLEVSTLVPIGDFLLSPGGCDERCAIFAGRIVAPAAGADGVIGGGGLASEQEDLRVRLCPAEEAIGRALAGAYPNSVTTIALLWLAANRERLRREWGERGVSGTATTRDGAEAMPALVSTGWLAERIGAPGIAVLDASWFLPTEGRDARAEFAQARLPGARFFDIDAIADTETALPHMAPSAGRFARMVGALGVSDDSRVVFYDAKGLFSAARGWWLMRLFGHDSVAVLDGGLPKWRAEGRAIETGPPRVPEPGRFTPTLRAGLLRGTGDMLDNLASGEALVLDARSAGRFEGSAPEPRAGMAGGHIPGARSLPYTELLAADGTMLAPDALRVRLAAAGADGSRPVVTSCGTGVTAAVVSLALVAAGLPPGALYDGSWTEWAQRPDTPKEPGAGDGA